jgi:hypothetical protein
VGRSDQAGERLSGGVAGNGQHEHGEGGGESPGVSPQSQSGAQEAAGGRGEGEQEHEAPVGWMPAPVRTIRATALVLVITTSDVPTAYSIGMARASSRAGTTRKPPPTPRKPVKSPTAVAVTTTLSAWGHWHTNRGPKLMMGSSGRLGPVTSTPGPADPASLADLPGRHRDADHEHERRESRQEHRLRNARRCAGPDDGATDRHHAEGHSAAEHHASGPVGRDCADQRGHADHDQRTGRRLGGALAEQVDQDGDRQDRAAAAQGAQAEPDQHASHAGDHEKGSRVSWPRDRRRENGCWASETHLYRVTCSDPACGTGRN